EHRSQQPSPGAMRRQMALELERGKASSRIRGVSDIDERFYFRQLLAGRDFARSDQIAQQMMNFVYLIGDRATGEAVAVDPAYAPGELVELLGSDGMTLTGVLVTHYHPDHVGGDLGGWSIAGVRELLAHPDVRAK